MDLKNKALLALLGLVQTANVWAMDKGMSPGMLPVGPFDFTPLLQLSESHNDNIFYNSQNPKASFITKIQGRGELALRRKLNRYALNYSFLSTQYHSSPINNYVDHTLGATAHLDITRRNRIDFNSGLLYGHNIRGIIFSQSDIATLPNDTVPNDTLPNGTIANDTLPIATLPIASQLNDPDQYHRYQANFNYRYGLSDAPGNLALQLGWSQLMYDNHLERTAQSDNTQLLITPGFYWRLRPKTYLTTQIQNTFVHYTNSNSNSNSLQNSGQDYSLRRYLMGVTWDQSAKTKGSISLGYYQQDYSNAEQQSSAGLTGNGQVSWSPLTYSTLNLGFSMNVQPNIGNASSSQVQVYNASWRHNWPKRITTQLSGAYQEAHNQNASQNIQAGAQAINSGITFMFDVKYQMRPWLDFGVNYLQSDYQTGTNDTQNTQNTQNIFMFYVQAR